MTWACNCRAAVLAAVKSGSGSAPDGPVLSSIAFSKPENSGLALVQW